MIHITTGGFRATWKPMLERACKGCQQFSHVSSTSTENGPSKDFRMNLFLFCRERFGEKFCSAESWGRWKGGGGGGGGRCLLFLRDLSDDKPLPPLALSLRLQP